jgi:hypothetical protein
VRGRGAYWMFPKLVGSVRDSLKRKPGRRVNKEQAVLKVDTDR